MKANSSKMITVLVACFAAIGALAFIASTTLAPQSEDVESPPDQPTSFTETDIHL